MMLQVMLVLVLVTSFISVSLLETMSLMSTTRHHLSTTMLGALADSAAEDSRDIIARRVALPSLVRNRLDPNPEITTLPMCYPERTECQIQVSTSFKVTDESTPPPAPPVVQPTPQFTTLNVNVAFQHSGPIHITIPVPVPQISQAIMFPTADPCSPNSAPTVQVCNLEVGGGVREGRVLVRLAVEMRNHEGVLLGSIRRYIRFRTLAYAPYALAVGQTESRNGLEPAEPGDSGGIPSQVAGDFGTLVHTFTPCCQLPDGSEEPIKSTWNNWQGTESLAPLRATCVHVKGDTSVFLPRTRSGMSVERLP